LYLQGIYKKIYQLIMKYIMHGTVLTSQNYKEKKKKTQWDLLKKKKKSGAVVPAASPNGVTSSSHSSWLHFFFLNHAISITIAWIITI
jgi:hypothetical protein